MIRSLRQLGDLFKLKILWISFLILLDPVEYLDDEDFAVLR